MASIYENLRNERQYKALTGLSIEKFNELYELFHKYYVPKAGVPEAGKPAYFQNPREALFFILVYYKTYPTLQHLGIQFGCSDKTAYDYLGYIKPVLKHCLSEKNSFVVEVFTNQEAFDKAFEGVEEVLVDGFEIPVQRKSDNAAQQLDYSGKKNDIPTLGSV
jgi:hypothetical protein